MSRRTEPVGERLYLHDGHVAQGVQAKAVQFLVDYVGDGQEVD